MKLSSRLAQQKCNYHIQGPQHCALMFYVGTTRSAFRILHWEIAQAEGVTIKSKHSLHVSWYSKIMWLATIVYPFLMNPFLMNYVYLSLLHIVIVLIDIANLPNSSIHAFQNIFQLASLLVTLVLFQDLRTRG